jgi:hypothetical protein
LAGAKENRRAQQTAPARPNKDCGASVELEIVAGRSPRLNATVAL